MKKLLLAFFILLTGIATAQQGEFEEQWQIVDSLELRGQVSSASEMALEIMEQAREQKDYDDFIKAKIFYYKFYQINHEQSSAFILADINRSLSQLPVPYLNVLLSYKAEFLQQYYNQHRWNIGDRTEIDTPHPTDLETWSAQRLRDSIRISYEHSLENEKKLVMTSPKAIEELLLESPLARKYHPTLYDLLAYRALEYFIDPTNFPKVRPELEYAFTSEALYADSESFLKLHFPVSEPTSSVKALQTYQELERLHSAQKNTEAKVYAQLERLEYVNENFRGDDKKNLYSEALDKLTEEYEGKPISALVLLVQARILNERASEVDENNKLLYPDFLRKAVAICDKIIEEFPNSDSSQNAYRLKADITGVEVNAKIPEILAAQKPGRLYVSYRNLDSLRLRIFRISESTPDYIPYQGRDSIIARLLLREPLVDQTLELPRSEDHNQHSTEFVLEGRDPGNYFVHISGKGTSGKEGYSYGHLEVSNLIYTETAFDDHTLYKTLDRTTGEAVPGVKIKFFNRNDKLRMEKVTDAEGKLSVSNSRNSRSGKILLIKNNDTLSNNYYQGRRFYREASEEPMARSMLYLDRHIYRPGQKVYFKGVLLKRENETTSTVPGEYVVVIAEDVNGEEVFRQRLKSNKYGSFSGEFGLPKTGITGSYRLFTEEDLDSDTPFWKEYNGWSVQFNVEEYKRPTFEVAFNEINKSYNFGDSIEISGEAKAFMGAPIGRAKVAYEVTRQQVIYTWWRRRLEDPVTIKIDTLTTDDHGNFSLTFPAEISRKDRNGLVYSYNIRATVTDVSGETREGSTSINLGNKNLFLNLELPENIRKKDSLHLSLKATNLNDRSVPVNATLRIYKLEAPDRILRERLWEAPEIQLIPEEKFKELIPEEPYTSTLPPEEWPRAELVFETKITDTSFFEIKVPVTEYWNSGKYVVEVSANNGSNTAEVKRPFGVTDPEDQYLPDNQRFSASLQNSNFRGEEKIELLVQTAYTDLNTKVSVYNGYKTVFDTFVNINGRAKFIIPIENVIARELKIHLHAIKNNTVIEENLTVRLAPPEKSLNIVTETFRNKIQPGIEETWSFKISDPEGGIPDAEVLASMYDASLDQFRNPYTHDDWQVDPGFERFRSYFPNFNVHRIEGVRNLTNEFPRTPAYSEFTKHFDQLSYFGFEFSNPGSWTYRRYLQGLKNQDLSDKLVGNTRGRVTDGAGIPLPAVNVIIEGGSKGTVTDFDGEFALDTKEGDVLVFSYLGFHTTEILIGKDKEIFVVLEEDSASLEEVVVTGYGQKIKVVEEAESIMELAAPPPPPVAQLLAGNVAGIEVQQLEMDQDLVQIRGSSTIGSGNTPLFIVDGVVVTDHQLNASDILSLQILKSTEAMALYGATAKNGAVIITTKQGLQELQQVEARKDLDETAFFFPHLSLDSDGGLKFSFTSPEALTQWKFRLLAHTNSWTTGTYEASVVTQKELSVVPNPPRFLREGDTIVFKSKITNMSSEPMTGTAVLQLFDAVTMEPIDDLLLLPSQGSGSTGNDPSQPVTTEGGTNNFRTFQISPNNSTSVSWKLHIPQGVQAVTYKMLAKAGNFNDGEENMLPVLSNRMLVNESLPMFVRAGETEIYEFETLKENRSETLEHHKFTVEYTANPAWYAIRSLPYLMEFPHECSEQIFSRIYANSLASQVLNSQPRIREVFEKWRKDSALVCPLEKNEELKSLILSETPWLRDAVSEKEQKQRIAELFELEQLSNELKENLDRLEKMQNSSGAFPWFSGGYDNYFITRHIVAGFGHLEALGVEMEDDDLMKGAVNYMDKEIQRILEENHQNDSAFYRSTSSLHYLYARSFHKKAFPPGKKVKQIMDDILSAQKENWLQRSLYDKALLMLVLSRNGEQIISKQIMVSLEESAVRSEDYGMYWKENKSGWYWYRAPIETQALLIEAFAEVGGDTEAIEEMKIWLLQNKRTNHWPTTKATTEAVYALLMQGEDWLQLDDQTVIEVGGEPLPSEKIAETKKEAGTGYLKVSWKGEEVKDSFSQIKIINKNKAPGYGGVYWQYFENLDKIKTHSETPLNIEKELFLNISGTSGTTLKQVTPETQLKPGDLITVRLLVRSTADMDYIHLKDMRASGFEPTTVLSEYKYQDGIGYYESTRDAATHFFFDRLPKGMYVLEYTVRANNSGSFSNGITTIESMYAPEFSGHTKGIRVEIKE